MDWNLKAESEEDGEMFEEDREERGIDIEKKERKGRIPAIRSTADTKSTLQNQRNAPFHR